MKTWKKVAISLVVVVVLCGIVGFTIYQSRKNVVAVQTGTVKRLDLTSIVSASGEIKPKTYVNIGANAYGKIIKLYVKEGDKVKRGQLLAQLENVQPSADVAANRAALEAARTDAVASEAGLKTAQADMNRAKSDGERARLDFERAEGLYKAALIPKQEYDAKKAAWEAADAGLAQAAARVAQSKAQVDSSERRIHQNAATLTRASDALSKTVYTAPYDGIITNVPVREGEVVVMGIQNAPGSTLMTLSDMGIITAEVKVDETDIVNVRLGQTAEVTIDAIPKKIFKGTVTEIGDNAMLRSTGLSTSQSTSGSQEAKDFKVVVTLQEPPQNLRPGMSCTAKVTTASRTSVASIPIQALTVRSRRDLEDIKKKGKDAVQAAAPEDPKSKEELTGVFVVRNKKVEFVPVQTGVTGTTDIEVVSGLKEGDEIVTGSYKVLRSLKNGVSVKIDNSVPKKQEDNS
ncbi:MAG TPA: efflux RND transporter periplasmic adaptor subunit [Terriglobales bacterium]|jgi:HlyD family secretion protein|nr:efflux RND transporter periplasmic adaptor subunit [Terriglobales bacterium]